MRLLTNGEILALLNKYAFDCRYTGRNKVQMKRIAELCEVSRDYVDGLVEGKFGFTEKYRHRFSLVLEAIEGGRLKFEHGKPPTLLDQTFGTQGRMVRADEWLDVPCRYCRKGRWETVWNGFQEMRVCANCIPPEQYPFLHLDTKMKRGYKRLTERNPDIGGDPRVQVQRLRPPVRVDGRARRRLLPAVRGKRA